MSTFSSCSRSIFKICSAVQGIRIAIPRPIVQAPTALLTRPFTNTLTQRDVKKPTSTPASAPGLRPTTNFPSEDGSDPREVFSELDVLSGLPIPTSAVDSVFAHGFLLNNGQEIHGDGVFVLNNDVFRWKALLSGSDDGTEELEGAIAKARRNGILELNDEVWGVLDVVYPKPDLLIIGTGHRTLLLHPHTRKRIQEMGINLDVMDTQNAAAQYNLLATERPGTQVAAALLMAGFG